MKFILDAKKKTIVVGSKLDRKKDRSCKIKYFQRKYYVLFLLCIYMCIRVYINVYITFFHVYWNQTKGSSFLLRLCRLPSP